MRTRIFSRNQPDSRLQFQEEHIHEVLCLSEDQIHSSTDRLLDCKSKKQNIYFGSDTTWLTRTVFMNIFHKIVQLHTSKRNVAKMYGFIVKQGVKNFKIKIFSCIVHFQR